MTLAPTPKTLTRYYCTAANIEKLSKCVNVYLSIFHLLVYADSETYPLHSRRLVSLILSQYESLLQAIFICYNQVGL